MIAAVCDNTLDEPGGASRPALRPTLSVLLGWREWPSGLVPPLPRGNPPLVPWRRPLGARMPAAVPACNAPGPSRRLRRALRHGPANLAGGGQRMSHDGLGLAQDPVQVLLSQEALGVDLVHVFSSGRPGGEPAVLGRDLDSTK